MSNEKLFEYHGRQKDNFLSSAIPFAILQVIDSVPRVVIMSDGLCNLLQDERERIVHRVESQIHTNIHPEDIEKCLSLRQTLFVDNQPCDLVFRTKIGENMRSLRLQASSYVEDTGERLYTAWVDDVTDILKAEQNSTYYDKLTGLPNMAAFCIMAESERNRMKEKYAVPAFVYFDVRDMKAINEKHGFSKGNGILTGITYVLKDVFANCAISRFADDHFVVLTERRQVEQKIEQVYESTLKNPLGIPVQLCAGIYIDDKNNMDVYAACDRARLACRSLKGDYARKYKVFDREMFTVYRRRRHILNHFEDALENGYIKLYYQPIIRTVTGRICDMEALARWVDPEKGMLPPAQFISVLEDNRLINKLDFYMLKKICESLVEMKSQDMPLVPVSVNLSRINFELCDVVEEVMAIVDEYNIAHNLITIEITESAFINNKQFLENQINRFRKAGFNVWMDDFGSEYSSLNTLQEYSFDLIKLDMRFMKNFSLTGKNRLILSDIISMLSKLGVHTLAEGVQTKEQLRFLRDAGCDKVQGYLFSKPMPCEYFYNKSVVFKSLEYDDIKREDYYRKIESTNLGFPTLPDCDNGFSGDASGTPSAILEFHGDTCKILKANNAYKNLLEMIGLDKDLISGDYYDWRLTPAPEMLAAAKKCLSGRKNESIDNYYEGEVRLSANLVSIAYEPRTDIGAILVVITRIEPGPRLIQ